MPTEKRVERWSDDDHKAVHETQAFLTKPLPEVQEFFEQHPPKLKSCACEFCWGAAAVVIYSRLVRAIREGNPEDIKKAMDALLRALVRINFCYSREHFLLLDVPEDGVKQCTNQIVASKASEASSRRWRRKHRVASPLLLNHGLHAIDATPAPWHGDAVLRPRNLASTAALSPRNDFAKNYAPSSLIDLRTGPSSAATS